MSEPTSPLQNQPEPAGASVLAHYQRTIERLTRLQGITAALASATTLTAVGQIIVEQALPSLGAIIGVVAVLDPQGRTLTNVQFQGVSAATQDEWSTYSIDSPVPVAEAALRATPILVRTQLERNQRYPALAAAHGAEHGGAVVAYPLLQRGRVLGSLGFCFAEDRPLDAPEQAYLQTIAQQCATALGRIQDDQARKAAEQKLQESQSVLSLAMRGGRMGAWSRELATNKVWWSRELEEIFGLPEDGFAGSEAGFFALVHADDQPKVMAAVDAAISGGHDYAVEFRYKHSSGAWRWMEGRGRALYGPDGKPTVLYGLGIDIEERKRAEEALFKSRTQLQLISDIAPIYLASCDRQHRFKFANKAYAERLGLRGEELIGRHIREILGEQGYALALPHIERVLLGEPVHYTAEIPYPGIGRKWMECRYAPEVDEEGAVQGWVAAIRDVTQEKQSEAALREADRRKDEFLAMLAHELRNPLGPIRNGVHLLRKVGEDRSAPVRILDMIERQSEHMSRIVDDLLDVSRITRGKILLRREELDLDALIHAIAHDYAPQFHQREVALTIRTPGLPVCILGDRTRITQSLGNLLHNAQKFTHPGGTTTVTLSTDAEQAYITVADSGIGMDETTLARLFIPFAQAEQSLERSAGGLGLGLSLVQGLVQLHGGTVTAESDGIGRGSTLRVHLPLLRECQPAAPRAASPARPALQRILIVEDNPDAADSLQMLLEVFGHTVAVAGNGPAALKRLESETPDVIICDIGLPGMSGYEVARAVRAQPRFRRTFMVALTGYGQQDDQRAALDSGFDIHLTKPVDPDQLETLINPDSAPRAK